ncbi:hypothetical protein QQP08_023993 [Theobroma cacao]|nr:hypothetical protein QQP08_023993 [Theobroma cacao]
MLPAVSAKSVIAQRFPSHAIRVGRIASETKDQGPSLDLAFGSGMDPKMHSSTENANGSP